MYVVHVEQEQKKTYRQHTEANATQILDYSLQLAVSAVHATVCLVKDLYKTNMK